MAMLIKTVNDLQSKPLDDQGYPNIGRHSDVCKQHAAPKTRRQTSYSNGCCYLVESHFTAFFFADSPAMESTENKISHRTPPAFQITRHHPKKQSKRGFNREILIERFSFRDILMKILERY